MLTEGPFNDVSREIIGAAIEAHRHLGPGLLESTYMPCLLHELHPCRLDFVTQRLAPVRYKSLPLDASYRIDLMVGRNWHPRLF